jgi:hypothetical protein
MSDTEHSTAHNTEPADYRGEVHMFRMHRTFLGADEEVCLPAVALHQTVRCECCKTFFNLKLSNAGRGTG